MYSTYIYPHYIFYLSNLVDINLIFFISHTRFHYPLFKYAFRVFLNLMTIFWFLTIKMIFALTLSVTAHYTYQFIWNKLHYSFFFIMNFWTDCYFFKKRVWLSYKVMIFSRALYVLVCGLFLNSLKKLLNFKTFFIDFSKHVH